MGNVVVAAERLPKLEDYLCFAVYSANLSLHRLLKPLLDEVGLTYPQYLVLIALYDDDHQTVGGLGDKLFLDSSTLTPLLKRMEANPQDERQVRIRLTPQGRSVREKGIGFRADYVETTDLMPAASRQLRQDMAKLRENLSKATQAIARRAPQRVGKAHLTNKLANFGRCSWPAAARS